MNKYLIIFITVVAGLMIVTSVQAQFGIERLRNQANHLEKRASISAANQGERLTAVKQRADRMIVDRINELDRLLSRIQTDQRLSSDDKTSLSSDIQTDINGLTALKAKVDADTDLNTAKTDAKQIITSYYIYKMFVPKTRLMIIINNLQSLTQNLQAITPQIQNIINTLKSQGKDVSSLQSLLNDIDNRLQTITSTLSTDKTEVQAVSATTTDPNSVFTQVRKDLASVRTSFAGIRNDISQMRVDFRVVILGGSNQPSTSSESAK